jgi:peptidoglycan hydrolase-like protein with peptidoglycan-binding domain
MDHPKNTRALMLAVSCVLVAQLVAAVPASAYSFDRVLQRGDAGRDVKALEIRVAGWYPSGDQTSLRVDWKYTRRTAIAVRAFQSFYGLSSDGVAGAATFEALNSLQDANGSTTSFAWGEFKQNSNSSCSAKANAYAGTFDGGMGSPSRVRHYVRQLMWRLEALRAKGGGHAIGINSGFRSLDYNSCIGGASSSQHLYGTAADQKMAAVTNHKERLLGENSDFSGIGCYSQLTHNHFDIRVNNGSLPSSQFWWWPQQNRMGEDLDDQSQPCYGEVSAASSAMSLRSSGGSDVLSAPQVRTFAAEGETGNLGSGD